MSRAEDKICGYFNEICYLSPTPKEIDIFAKVCKEPYGVITYNTYKYGHTYFLSVHDNHRGKKHYHIDLGYADLSSKYNNVTHLMLDNHWAPIFITFIKEYRGIK